MNKLYCFRTPVPNLEYEYPREYGADLSSVCEYYTRNGENRKKRRKKIWAGGYETKETTL